MIDPALLGHFKFMPNCSVGPSNVKRSSPQKKFGMGHVKMHGFYGNLLYDSRDRGGRPTNSIISRVLLILEH